ncbi:hypothetical protein EC5412_2830 [Escherichia coli 5412]|nr:hypothetical protein EC5412_2830 [Escherichia coli 5412]
MLLMYIELPDAQMSVEFSPPGLHHLMLVLNACDSRRYW